MFLIYFMIMIMIVTPIILILLTIFMFPNNTNSTYSNTQFRNSDYIILNSPMTITEIKFYNQLKEITNKYDLNIIPQLQLQRIFKVINKNNYAAFNRIKSKSIDYAIVNNNFEYKLFIELDDYTHNYNIRIKRDEFVNQLFETHNLKLLRIKVKNNYDINEIEEKITEILKEETQKKQQEIIKKY